MFTATVNFSGNGSGRIVSSPPGIDCPGTCSMSAQPGTTIVLAAQPASGSTFAGWGGSCHGPGGCSLTADGQVFADFEATPPPPPPPPPADECADLMRSVAPGPATATHSDSTGSGFCAAGMSDGFGTLALQSGSDNDQGFTLDFVTPDGKLLASYPHSGVILTEQFSGFEGTSMERVDPTTFTNGWMLRTWDTAGHQVAQQPTPVSHEAQFPIADPLGGMMILDFTRPAELRAYDTQLNLRWQVPLPQVDRTGSYGAMVDRAGNTLMLSIGNMQTAPNTVDGMWIDHGGHAGPLFRIAGPFTSFVSKVSMAARVGSGLFIGIEDGWVGQIDTLSATAMSPAPAWLQQRPRTTLHGVRNGTGYAVLPPGASTCTHAIEIVSASGKVCGAVPFKAAASSCNLSSIRVGFEGSVILNYQSAPGQCVWEWWAHIFG